jgi:transcriptional regulator with XRE-family HTH domain
VGEALLDTGEAFRVNHNTIWRIEGGDSVEVHPRTIRKIAGALYVDPASLVPQE